MVYPDDTNADPLIGQVINDRYTITECIGGGAMGAVYRAEQIGLARSVALKLLSKDANWTEDTILRFHREAQAASALTHPNTVRVFDFGATPEGLLYLAMEVLEGEPITNYLRRNKVLTVRDTVEYGRQILRSLSEAHAKGIIHRDIKPDNVFLARVEGQETPIVKILDFGIAKAVAGERTIDQFETQDGTVFGTPRYMSPEQAQGKSIDSRSDLYAVGITLFEFLTGDPPFVDKDAVVVMAKHIREHAPPIRRVRPERPIPASLEKVVQKALKKSPDKRFQTADEFAQALEDCLPDVTHLEQAVAEGGFKKLISQIRLWPREKQIGLGAGASLALITIVLVVAAIANTVPNSGQPFDATSASRLSEDVQPESAPFSSSHTTNREAKVLLASEPPGANVWYKGEVVGVTPLKLDVEKRGNKTVRLSKPGYTDFVTTVSADESPFTVTLHAAKEKADFSERRKAPSSKTPNRTKQARLKHEKSKSTGSPYEKFD